MSDQGEKMCPLCTELMDLTDQQLKPCKCGYEMCIWCWHHIIEMAEKDGTEARCPACRTRYDKEKIVGTAANCERVATVITMEKKKSQKTKLKTSEGRKQLSNVRVIQRNLVYIVGLPLNLADEDLLLRKEYFGQYGKVLKVSVSRTSGGAIQQFQNNTCSVYITYAKEEEAVRCIQSIHGFTLDGRSMRACFGTTKYCHAWLRNAPCTNPDCLYLHEIGSQVDSFTKDEIISAYSRVQQITGITNTLSSRSGNVFPPPVDDNCPNTSVTTAKPAVISTSNNLANSAKICPPASISGKNCALPAAASWGTRASNGQSSAGSFVCSNGPAKQKCHAAGAPLAFSATVAGMAQTSSQCSDLGENVKWENDSCPKELESKPRLPENLKQLTKDLQTNKSDNSRTPLAFSATVAGMAQTSSQCSDLGENVKWENDSCPKELESKPRLPENLKQLTKDLQTNKSDNSRTPVVTYAAPIATAREPSSSVTLDDSNCRHSAEEQSNCVVSEKVRACSTDEKNHKLCSVEAPMSDDKQLTRQYSEVARTNGLSLDCFLVSKDKGLQHYNDAKLQEKLASPPSRDATATDIAIASRPDDQSSAMLNLPPEKEGNVNVQGVLDSVVPKTSVPASAHPFDLSNYSRIPPEQSSDPAVLMNRNLNPSVKWKEEQVAALASHASSLSYGLGDDLLPCTSGISNSRVLPNELFGNQMVTSDSGAINIDLNPGMDVIESSIISNILSLDLDAWDDSLTSPHDLVKLLGENERPQDSVGLSGSLKAQNSNQSKFSFARQEESQSHLCDIEPLSTMDAVNFHSYSPALPSAVYKEPYMDRLGNGFGIPHCNVEMYNGFGSSQSVLSTDKLSVSRAQISAPPGFSGPSRSPPPGFSVHRRSDQTFDMKYGNYCLETTSRDPYIASPSTGMSSVVDIEFIDPAILAVGKGVPSNSLSNSNVDVRSTMSSHYSVIESDNARLQFLMQSSLQPHQNHRYADIGDHYFSNDAHVFSSRHLESSQTGYLLCSQFGDHSKSAMSNCFWDKWPEVMAGNNNMGMAGLFRNDQLGFNKLYGGYEESKFQMPNSADLYRRTFGM